MDEGLRGGLKRQLLSDNPESITSEYGDEPKEERSDQFWVDLVMNYFSECKSYRSSRMERQWMINMAFYKGWQNVKYDKRTGRLNFDEKDPLDFYTNKVQSTIRAVRSAVTRDQPTWDVDTSPYGEPDALTERMLAGYLAGMNDKLGMKHIDKELVLYGLLYGLGIYQYGYNAEANGGLGEVEVRALDPFDTYIDHLATGEDDWKYVVKVVKRRLSEVKANEHYDEKNRKDLQADNQNAASEYKNLLLSRDNSSWVNGGGNYGEYADGSVLVYEGWCYFEDKVHVITVCNNKLLRHEETDLSELPFILYQADITSNEIYGEGWVKNLIPLNRALNYLEKSVLEYNILMAKGKYLVDSNANVKTVTNENGEIIRVSPGSRFEQMTLKPMSSTPFNQINNLNMYIQEIGAANDAFMGKTPTGVTSGVAIEQLVANNFNNLTDLIDNFEMAKGKLGEKILMLAHNHYDTTRFFRFRSGSGPEQTIKVGGKSVSGIDEMGDVVQIPPQAKVKVRVVSGVAYTKQGRQELMVQLREMGDVDRKTFLDAFNLDSDEIMMRLQEEQMMAMQPPMPPEEGMPMEGGVPPQEAMLEEGLVPEAENGVDLSQQEVAGQELEQREALKLQLEEALIRDAISRGV